jgi:hypothetical protein
MSRAKISDEVIDAIAFIEMHRQESEKESGSAAACAEALPKLQALLDELGAETAEPPDVHAANIAAVTNDIARVKRLSSGGGGGNKHPRPAQKKPMQRQHAQGHGHQPQGPAHGHPAAGQGHGPNQGNGPNQGQGRRRGRNKRRGGGGGNGGGGAGGAGGGPRGAPPAA